MDYTELLERAKKDLPEVVEKNERFDVPRALGHIQGNKTIISNFYQIAQSLNRNPEHLLKYILKELATPGELKKSGFIIGTKISASRINEKLDQYVKDFVICSECKKPDTTLLREDKLVFIKCQVCGAKHPVRYRA